MKKTLFAVIVVAMALFLAGSPAFANSSAKKNQKDADCKSCCCGMKGKAKGKATTSSAASSKASSSKKESDKK